MPGPRPGSKVFRKVALERLSSPEQLDQLLQVTRPQGWIAAVVLVMLSAVVVVWGFWGLIPTEAAGEGILLRQGGVGQVVSAGSGQVEEILVAVGEQVRRGQVVARIRQDALERQIKDAETRRRDVEAERRELTLLLDAQRTLSLSKENQQRGNLERSIATLERQERLLAEKTRSQEELLQDGLVTQQTLLGSEQELTQTRDQLASKRLELAGLKLSRLESEQALDQQLEEKDRRLRELDLELRELQASLQENVEMRSTVDGRVLELVTALGDVVSPGTPLLSLEVASEEELIAVLFVPAEQGKQIQVGMDARITPTTVKREEHGFIQGEVQWVAKFPSTSLGMERLLANQGLVERLMSAGPPIQINVKLERDADTPSGFSWSSSRGPDITISTGTLAAGGVIVRRERPVELIIPTVRKKLGL